MEKFKVFLYITCVIVIIFFIKNSLDTKIVTIQQCEVTDKYIEPSNELAVQRTYQYILNLYIDPDMINYPFKVSEQVYNNTSIGDTLELEVTKTIIKPTKKVKYTVTEVRKKTE